MLQHKSDSGFSIIESVRRGSPGPIIEGGARRGSPSSIIEGVAEYLLFVFHDSDRFARYIDSFATSLGGAPRKS